MQLVQTTQSQASIPSRGQRGVSLIEILVALVILVLGILSVIRLFPGGFLVVRSAENSTFADRLGQAAVESLKNNGGGLPDGIYTSYVITDANGNRVIQFDPNVRPDNLGSYTLPGTGIADPFSKDINKSRFISNETITVPAGRVVNNTPLPPIHALNFGPIALSASAVPAPDDAPPGFFEANLSVLGVPWTTKAGDSRSNINAEGRPINDPQDELSEGQTAYMVDYDAAKIAVPPADFDQTIVLVLTTRPGTQPGDPPSRTYYVRLTVPEKSANTSDPNTVNNYNGGWFSLKPINGVQDFTYVVSVRTEPATSPVAANYDLPWISGSTTLYREFRCKNNPQTDIDTSPPFTDDPYEYKLVNANFATSGGFADANIGTLAFNPLAAGRNGRAPLQARISYLTYDWHIIKEDRDVADGSTIRLTLNNLKKIGDPLTFPDTRVSPASGVYTGLIPDASASQDFFLLDLDSGRLRSLTSADVNDSDDSPFSPNLLNVSYNAGRIVLPTLDPNAPTYVTDKWKFGGGHLRIFYAGDLDWGVAVQKAPSLYQAHIDPTNGQVGPPTSSDPAQPGALHVGEYFILGNDIYFPLCDAGKTVEFDGVKYTDNTGSQQTVSDVALAIPDLSTTVAGVPGEYLRLNASQLGLPNYQSGMTANLSVTTIRGVSARAVVIWRERGEWKTRNVDTLLTRTQ